MNSRAKRLVEMALDLGGVPDWIDREKKRRISSGEHPYGKNPAWPKEPGQGSFPQGENEPRPGHVGSYAELVTSDVYPKIVRKLQAALGGRIPPGGPMQIMMQMQQAVARAMQFEEGHEQQLEQAAVRIVLDLPEFAEAKKAYEANELKFNVKLVKNVDLGGTSNEPEEPDDDQKAELEVAQIAQELDLEKEKRRMINLMIQGSAINKDHAYMQIADELNQISPQLTNCYALMMSGGELAYWIMPEQMQQAMQGSGEGAAGAERLTFDENGVPVVNAQAIVFPVLIQETVKGLMEYLSYDDNADSDTQKYTYGQTDTLGNEIWDIKFGPAVWRQILRMIGNDNQEYMPYVYRHLIELPTSEFNKLMQQILRGEPEARQVIDGLVAKVKQEQEGKSAPEPPSFDGGSPDEGPEGGAGTEPPGGGSDTGGNPDWWKHESKTPGDKIVKRLLGD